MSPSAALVSRDPHHREALHRLCAAAGLSLAVCPDAPTAAWRSAVVVLVATDCADAVARLPRRPAVLLLAGAGDGAGDDVATWRAAARVGAEDVLCPGVDDRALLERLTRAAEAGGPAGRQVAVVPGSAGAGASTTAVAVALVVAAAGPATLVDLDPRGGGLDLLLGMEHADGARWPQLAATRGVVRAAALDAALPRRGALRVVSAGREDGAELPAAAVDSVLDAARRLGPVVVDLPPAATPSGEAALRGCDASVLVVRAEVRAVAAAAVVLSALTGLPASPLLAVRVSRRDRIGPADVARALGMEPAAVIATDAGVPVAGDRGELARVLARGRVGSAGEELARLLFGAAA
jgi:secretion/DNA translocation related CpaE-like protein